MNLRDKVRALEPQVVAASMVEDLTIGDECIISYKGDDYGIWRFEGAVSGRLHFSDGNNACLSIPKAEGRMAAADGWLVIPEG
jgi:hypothetical protein